MPLLAASAFGLFAPLDMLEFLGIAFWRVEGKPYLGSVFVLSVAVTGVHYCAYVVHWLVEKYRKLFARRAAQARLKCLTTEEKEFLAWYMDNDSRSRKCWVLDSTASVLLAERILYVAVEKSPTNAFPFTVYPWVWDYLKKNRHLVEVKATIAPAQP